MKLRCNKNPKLKFQSGSFLWYKHYIYSCIIYRWNSFNISITEGSIMFFPWCHSAAASVPASVCHAPPLWIGSAHRSARRHATPHLDQGRNFMKKTCSQRTFSLLKGRAALGQLVFFLWHLLFIAPCALLFLRHSQRALQALANCLRKCNGTFPCKLI